MARITGAGARLLDHHVLVLTGLDAVLSWKKPPTSTSPGSAQWSS